ncbi:hypothetical protein BC936DRAFT_143878, partial [Jimgerdemannia flammicorona]
EKADIIGRLKSQGAEFVFAEFNDHASLVKAVRGLFKTMFFAQAKLPRLTHASAGIDVVASALSPIGLLEPELALMKASQETGVKRYIPSEFGMDTARCVSMFRGFWRPKVSDVGRKIHT